MHVECPAQPCARKLKRCLQSVSADVLDNASTLSIDE